MSSADTETASTHSLLLGKIQELKNPAVSGIEKIGDAFAREKKSPQDHLRLFKKGFSTIPDPRQTGLVFSAASKIAKIKKGGNHQI